MKMDERIQCQFCPTQMDDSFGGFVHLNSCHPMEYFNLKRDKRLRDMFPGIDDDIWDVLYDENSRLWDTLGTSSVAPDSTTDQYEAPLRRGLLPTYSNGVNFPQANTKPRLFRTFWTLTMSDLNVPASYDREEKRRLEDHVERVMAQLYDEGSDCFPSKVSRGASIDPFLQLCLLPRACFSDLDALYSARFIHTLHQIKTPSFSTLICYDKLFCDIAPIVVSLSENKANHYGRFLCSALETIMHWHKDKGTFKKECTGYPGFITKFRNADGSARDEVNFENFRHVVHKWHFKLTKTFLTSLASGSHAPVRNALLVLIKILPEFPAVKQFAHAIEKRVVRIRDEEKEKRQDLHVLAASYLGHLKVRKGPTITESDFHIVQKTEQRPSRATIFGTQDTHAPSENAASTNSRSQIKSSQSVSSA